MICPNCGTEITENDGICAHCGASVNVHNETPGKGFAVASLVLGIVSLFIFPYIAGVLAVVFGILAKKGGSSKMATAGIVLGIIGAVGWLLI